MLKYVNQKKKVFLQLTTQSSLIEVSQHPNSSTMLAIQKMLVIPFVVFAVPKSHCSLCICPAVNIICVMINWERDSVFKGLFRTFGTCWMKVEWWKWALHASEAVCGASHQRRWEFSFRLKCKTFKCLIGKFPKPQSKGERGMKKWESQKPFSMVIGCVGFQTHWSDCHVK